MITIGFAGEKQSGKSTLAHAAQEILPGTPHVEISDIISEVANDYRKLFPPAGDDDIETANQWLKVLPEIVDKRIGLKSNYGDFAFSEADYYDQPADYLTMLTYVRKASENPNFLAVDIDHSNKLEHREILQALGAAVVRVEPTAWFEEAYRRINRARTPLTTLGLVSTVAYIGDADFVRDKGGVITKVIRTTAEELNKPQLDPTDRERSAIIPDITVINDGSVEQLRTAGKHLVSLVQYKQFPNTIVCSEL